MPDEHGYTAEELARELAEYADIRAAVAVDTERDVPPTSGRRRP